MTESRFKQLENALCSPITWICTDPSAVLITFDLEVEVTSDSPVSRATFRGGEPDPSSPVEFTIKVGLMAVNPFEVLGKESN